MLFSAVMQHGVNKVAIHPSDEFDGYLLGTNGFAFAVIGATAEDFLRHRGDHI